MAGGSPEGSGSNRPGALWPVNDPDDWLTMSSPAWGGGWWDGRRAIPGYHAVVGTHWAFDGVAFPPEGITGGEGAPDWPRAPDTERNVGRTPANAVSRLPH